MESTSKGTKGKWFSKHIPDIRIPDFPGSLDERMTKLNDLLAGQENIVLVGSSFGGLMATIYALENEGRVSEMFLLAPALNFPDFSRYSGRKTGVPTQLFIGRQDDICPPDTVIPRARETFTNLTVHKSDDDHPLRNTFPNIDWKGLLPV